MTRAMLSLVLLAALSGCAHTKYVTVPCLSEGQRIPEEPERVGSKLTGQAQEDFKIVAGSAVELRAWGRGLRGILEGCTKP